MKRRGRALRRRYGRAKLRPYPLTLRAYGDAVDGEIRHGVRAVNSEAERTLVIEGWRLGDKPILAALAIEKQRRGR